MCLAVPMQIRDLEMPLATVEVAGVSRQVNVELVDQPKIGDYVVVHAGYAIEKLTEEEALETLDLLRQVAELGDDEPPPTPGIQSGDMS
ncbi:MAG: HypC/HybG/HupF family hydrogenase formation chaperone [Deltaproteobacteria bacterium]|nr:HypC/HybG/HupF family hydrogenase formation chaperone [Deltaproteobacteria bacterium]